MKNDEKLLVASFFSGCGGMDLGFEGGFWANSKSVSDKICVERSGIFSKLAKTGFETVFACDVKSQAKTAWERRFCRNGVFELESIVDLVRRAKVGEYSFPKAKVVTGGFPCQDFSVAGKRGGFSSHRSHKGGSGIGLPSEETRGMLYYWLREAIGLIRPNVFVAENVKGLASLGDAKRIITEDFRNVAGGYEVIEPRILKAWDYGVPQSRERIIFIGIRRDAMKDGILKKLRSGELDPYPMKTHAAGGYVSVREAIGDLPEPEESDDPSHMKYSKAKWYGRHCQGQTEVSIDGLAPTIRAEHHGNIEFRRLSKENGGKIVDEFHLPQRRLSVRECARLQTFPDDFEFVMEGLGASEAYKLIGNAVPPLLAYRLADRLAEIWNDVFEEG